MTPPRSTAAAILAFYRNIILPLTKPILSALAIFVFLGAFNAYLWPLVILNEEKKLTLPLIIARMANRFGRHRLPGRHGRFGPGLDTAADRLPDIPEELCARHCFDRVEGVGAFPLLPDAHAAILALTFAPGFPAANDLLVRGDTPGNAPLCLPTVLVGPRQRGKPTVYSTVPPNEP